MRPITPCLWFDDQAEDAATFYTSVFPDSKILKTSYYGEGAPKPAGSVLMVEFELQGQTFTALNGGPQFTFDEAISFQISCADQGELDSYWETLSAGGEEGPCGWLKDRFGLSWQVVPADLDDLMSEADPAASQRVMDALLTMGKLDLEALRRAHADA